MVNLSPDPPPDLRLTVWSAGGVGLAGSGVWRWPAEPADLHDVPVGVLVDGVDGSGRPWWSGAAEDLLPGLFPGPAGRQVQREPPGGAGESGGTLMSWARIVPVVALGMKDRCQDSGGAVRLNAIVARPLTGTRKTLPRTFHGR
jgi:hypothetical protein